MNVVFDYDREQTLNNTKMKYYTIYEACADLMWFDDTDQVHEVTILSDDLFRWRPTEVKIIVNQNGTYKLID